jgi:hypothetical protein
MIRMSDPLDDLFCDATLILLRNIATAVREFKEPVRKSPAVFYFAWCHADCVQDGRGSAAFWCGAQKPP